MVTTAFIPDLVLRSLEADWNRARWETLPADGNRYEIIDGILYVATTPSTFHQWISRQIARVLFQQVDDIGAGVTFYGPLAVFLSGCEPVQPDLIVIRTADLGVVQGSGIEGVPALLVEILSPFNPQHDTQLKRAAYARARVPEYWIVRPATCDVLVLSQPDPILGDYTQSNHVLPSDELVSPTLPVRVNVAAFFAGAPDTTL